MNRKYRRTAEIYKIFSEDQYDFSEEALQEMYEYESTGKGNLAAGIFSFEKINGYYVGKRFLNITVSMWFDDMEFMGWYTQLKILYEDPAFPWWWLDKTFKSFLKKKDIEYSTKGLKQIPSKLVEDMKKEIKDG